MNPINSLSAELQKTKSKLKAKTLKYDSLIKSQDKLVSDLIISDNKLDLFNESVSVMCNNCSELGSMNCENCPLHKFL